MDGKRLLSFFTDMMTVIIAGGYPTDYALPE